MVIEVYYRGSLEIDTSLFKNNVALEGHMESIICVSIDVSVKLRDSTFFNNSGIYTGSICISNSQAEIKNVSFIANSAVQASCIYAPNKSVVNVTDSEFDLNRVGSVVYATPGSKLRIADSIFTNHIVPEDSLIEIENAHLDLINCTVTNNTMGKVGGIVQASTRCQVTVSKCLFEKNAGRFGAVFYLSIKSSLFINNSQFYNNVAFVGGCFYIVDSSLDITESIFSKNTAHVYGGAIVTERSNITMKYSHFDNHKSGATGGVLAVANSSLVARNCTIENNSSPVGSAIYKSLNGQVIMDSCFLGMNTGPGGLMWYYHHMNSILRISNTECSTCEKCGPCIRYIGKDGYNFTMYTSNFTIKKKNIFISSSESNFTRTSLEYGVIVSIEGNKMYHEHLIQHFRETAFASGIKMVFLFIH